ncbi:hypothetical protein [Actinomadura kijaniata]|uniref:hypothetical protein n=1 Tax=Actinomadura kijaniata TaxID=46161 RepID=UPI00082B3651|nr:hypothetical protein [Actinomadura kijaniata]
MEPPSLSAEPQRADAPGADGATAVPTRVPRTAVAAFAATAAAGVWIGAVALSAGHGFDVTDEGFYLLSYRWWNTDLRSFTGAQYLYGPVFDLLGHDIAALRLFRLCTVVGVHLVFGWSFMRWLRPRRPHAPGTRLWEAAGTAAVVACGGLVYSWLPLSPGYNDVSVLGGLLAAALVLRIATSVDRGTAVPAWTPAALGPVAVATLLAKWTSSALILALIATVAAVALAPQGLRAVVRCAAWALGGAAAAALAVHLFVIPWTAALPEMVATNRLIAGKTNSPLALLGMYARTGLLLLASTVVNHALLLAAAVFAAVSRTPAGRRGAAVLAGVGLSVSGWRIVAGGGLSGGSANLHRFPAHVLATLLLAVLIGGVVLLRRRAGRHRPALADESPRGWTCLAMLVLLPVLQAAGTGNPLHVMAINAFAAWGAIGIAVLTGVDTAPWPARWLTGAAIGGSVVLAAAVATDGVRNHPYRTAGRDASTVTAADVPALASLSLDRGTADELSGLRRALRPYLEPPGRAVMAFDEMAGVVLALDGRSVGEAWYSALDPARTAAGIRARCAGGQGWWRERSPVLLFRRPVSPTEVDALRSCGLDFATHYRQLTTATTTTGIRVYVPAAETP